MVPASLGKGDEGLVSDQFTLALAGSHFLHMRELGPSSDINVLPKCLPVIVVSSSAALSTG